ncbi:translocon component PTEX88, partial [Plasmodium cynomolgi strain B]
MAMLFLLLLLGLAIPRAISTNQYSIKHTGELVLTNQLNSLVNARVVPNENTFNLEVNKVINFPVQCIPHSAVDYNAERKKKPIYFIKHEFKNSLHLYKNNVNLMALNFPDKFYIVGIAANNGFILMITDVDIYRIDVKKKRISVLNVIAQKHANIMNNKEMFFTGVIADSKENHFFVISAIKQNYFILHVKYNEQNDYIEVINVIETVNGKSIRVLNGLAVVDDRLFITENAENVFRLTLNRNNNSVQAKNLHTFSNGDKIIGLSVIVMPDQEDTNSTRDHLIVNVKHVTNDKPSSEGKLYLMSIKKDDTVNVYSVLDLYSRDLNSLYFTIYDAHLVSEEEEYERGALAKELNNNKAKFLNLDSATTINATTDSEAEKAEKKRREEDAKYRLTILWTNNYNCTVNKGTIDLRNIKTGSGKEPKMPFISVTNQYALAPHVTSASSCSGKEKLLKDMCYYDAVNNYVSVLNKSDEYNEHYSGNFLFDGLKDFIAFDYKSHMDIHVLTYPLNNTVYVHVEKKNLIINLPKPFGICMDTYNSTENNVIVYITGNDDAQNYVNRCVIKKAEQSYECYNVYRKKNESNEYFQHISFITYEESRGNRVNYIYVTNNKTNIYKLTKQNDKWLFEEWLNLDDPNQR